MSKTFVIKYKFDQLYLGEIDREPVLTTLDNKNVRTFSSRKKALKFYRSANHKAGYTKELFDVHQVNRQ